MRRKIPLIALTAALAAPTVATAAPAAKIASKATPVEQADTTTIDVANTTSRALLGRVTIRAGGRIAAVRAVKLPRRSVTPITFKLRARALISLRKAGTQRATVTATLGHAGRRRATYRRSLTLRAAAAEPRPAPAATQPAPQPAPPPPAPEPAAPGSPATPAARENTWVGRMGGEGAYDDLEFTVADGHITLTKAPAVPVMCFSTDGMKFASGELFDAAGPWPIGRDHSGELKSVRVNLMVSREERTVTYKVTDLAQNGNAFTGKLGMIFYGIFPNTTLIVNCHGQQTFDAIPAT
jgi:hypothetical protein